MERESEGGAAVDGVPVSVAMSAKLIARVCPSKIATKLHAVASIMIDGVTIVAFDWILPNASSRSMAQLSANGAMRSRVGRTGSPK